MFYFNKNKLNLSKILKMKNGLFVITCLILLSSCKIIGTLKEMKKGNADIYSYNNNNQDVKFLPMHHLGKQNFYNDVKTKVIEYKKLGYKVYYERVIADPKLDSLQNDTLLRKFRKITGINDSYKARADSAGLFKKYIAQPKYEDMGCDSNDVWADITSLQFINEFEKQNGIVVLDSLDFAIKFRTMYNRKKVYTKKQIFNIVTDFRNAYLLKKVKEKAEPKILILYGAAHRKGFKKLFLEKK